MTTLPFGWATDTHLDHASSDALAKFLQELQLSQHQKIIFTGDISNGRRIEVHLRMLSDELPNKNVYFVCGNHDYYGTSIELTLQRVRALTEQYTNLHYLSDCAPVRLSLDETLIGVDGYADGRSGKLFTSNVWLNDYNLIKEFEGVGKQRKPYALSKMLQELGDKYTAQLEAKLMDVVKTERTVYVATHVPPFREAHWYNNKPGDDNWSPHFVCEAMGLMLKDVARQHPRCNIVVLAGHTHGGCNVQITDNLKCLVGWAEYGEPCLQRVGNLPAIDARAGGL